MRTTIVERRNYIAAVVAYRYFGADWIQSYDGNPTSLVRVTSYSTPRTPREAAYLCTLANIRTCCERNSHFLFSFNQNFSFFRNLFLTFFFSSSTRCFFQTQSASFRVEIRLPIKWNKIKKNNRGEVNYEIILYLKSFDPDDMTIYRISCWDHWGMFLKKSKFLFLVETDLKKIFIFILTHVFFNAKAWMSSFIDSLKNLFYSWTVKFRLNFQENEKWDFRTEVNGWEDNHFFGVVFFNIVTVVTRSVRLWKTLDSHFFRFLSSVLYFFFRFAFTHSLSLCLSLSGFFYDVNRWILIKSSCESCTGAECLPLDVASSRSENEEARLPG